MPAGRPSDYTPKIAAEICARIAAGRSLRSICKAKDMPNARTVFRWLAQHVEFSQQYAKACEERANALAEEALEIADDDSADLLSGENGSYGNSAAVQRARLRVDTRKWFAGKLAPKVYGDKVQHSGENGGPVEHAVTFKWAG